MKFEQNWPGTCQPNKMDTGHQTQTRGPWATIHSPDKNSYCTSANATQFLPLLPQQLGYKSDHTIKRSKVIIVSLFEQTK